MKTIDLNADVGEGIGNEAELLPLLSSCNISCGLHAGDDSTIREVIDLAMQHQVAIGAHPSFDDRLNFGRVEMNLSKAELRDLVQKQIEKLAEMTSQVGAQLMHVKPHGALYNMAAKSSEISSAIIDAILAIDSTLLLFGLAGSATQLAATGRLKFVAEGFADRRYESANQLMARSNGGLMMEYDEIETHVSELANHHRTMTPSGWVSLEIDSLCLHGDTPDAVAHAVKIRKMLLNQGFQIRPA